MKLPSTLARQITLQAKFILTQYCVLVNANVLWLVTLILALSWRESTWLHPITGHLIFLPLLFFPIRKKSNDPPYKDYSKRQRLLHFSLVICYLLAMAAGANKIFTQALTNDQHNIESAGAFMAIRPDLPETDPARDQIKSDIRKNFMAFGKWVKHEVREIKQLMKPDETKKKVSAGQVALIALTILIGIFLAAFLFAHALAASLFGDATGPLLMAMFGWGAITWICVIVIKNILKMPEHKKESK